MAEVEQTVPTGAGGGGPATIADGADVAQGNTADAAWSSGAGTVIALLKKIAGGAASDVTDRVARLLGIVTIANLDVALSTRATEATLDARTGSLTEAAPGTDTASSGINGRLQRIAQRITSLIALIPASLGQKTMANSLAVVIASDQASIPVAATLAAETVKVIGTVNQGTSPWVTNDPGLPDTLGQKTMANSAGVAIASDQSAIPVTPQTLTKGTQGATGFSVQELKDAGRVNIMWTAEFAATAAAEALLTITESRDGAATTTFTSKVITSGKRLRITSIAMSLESGGSTGTALQRGILRLRFNAAGAVVVGSPLQGVWEVGFLVAPALKGVTAPMLDDFPDGIEFLGDGTKQIGFTLTNPDWVVTTMIPTTRVTIFAYEY